VILLLGGGKRERTTVDFGDLMKPKNDVLKAKVEDHDAA